MLTPWHILGISSLRNPSLGFSIFIHGFCFLSSLFHLFSCPSINVKHILICLDHQIMLPPRNFLSFPSKPVLSLRLSPLIRWFSPSRGPRTVSLLDLAPLTFPLPNCNQVLFPSWTLLYVFFLNFRRGYLFGRVHVVLVFPAMGERSEWFSGWPGWFIWA